MKTIKVQLTEPQLKTIIGALRSLAEDMDDEDSENQPLTADEVDELADTLEHDHIFNAESAATDKQIAYIYRKFGKDVQTNIGWGVTDTEISSKVYGHGVVTTTFNPDATSNKDLRATHEYNPF
jgi:hypothetical protein